MDGPASGPPSPPCPRAALLAVADPSERRNLVALLEAEDIDVTSVAETAAAITLLSAGSFGIVLSELRLGGHADGAGLARWTLQNRPQVGLILLADSFPWIPAGSPLAVVPVLLKPIDLAALRRRVRRLLPLHELAAD